MRQILDTLLREQGAESSTTDDLDAALGQLRETPPFDLLAVDCMGPDRGGVAWLMAVREAAPQTRILVVSGETRKERIAAALDAGADEYLMKPFPREALREKLLILGLVK